MQGKHILLVDDDRDLVQSIKVFLEARDYEVSTAHNGPEAYERILERRPDLIVLDVMMDYDEEGMVFASALKSDGPTHAIPIIMLTGFGADQQIKQKVFDSLLGQEWPAEVYMPKPVRLRDLSERIAEMLARQEPQDVTPWPVAAEA